MDFDAFFNHIFLLLFLRKQQGVTQFCKITYIVQINFTLSGFSWFWEIEAWRVIS